MLTTVGQLLVNDALPDDLRDYTRELGKDETDAVLGEIARRYPDRYREICKRFVDLGRHAAFEEGATISLSSLVPVVDKRPMLDMVRRQADAIRASKRMSQSEKDDAIDTLYSEATKRLTDETYGNALANNNPFALQAKFKARGNKNQLGAMLTSPGTYTDSEGKLVPIFIGSSYAEGLKPHEYWAASYGARLGVVSTKLATQKGGYLSKMLNSASIDQVVTEDDCGTSNGVPVAADDNDNLGAVLQESVAGFTPGTVITKPVLDKIKASGADEIMVRSPITCAAKSGLCKHCVGIRETGRFPDIGYNVGINAASALGEQIAQNSLNAKHCLDEDTEVLMANFSVRRIKDLRPGDAVIGSDLAGNTRPVQVLALFDNGYQPCVETRFRTKRHRRGVDAAVVSTTNHKILCNVRKDCNTGYCGLGIRTIGTKARWFNAATPASFDDTGYRSEPYAMLLGALVGDGCYTSAVSGVHLSCADPTEVADLAESISGTGLRLTRLRHHGGIYYRVSMPEGSPDRLGNPVKNLLVRESMYGKCAHDKDVPATIWDWDNESVGAFVGGLIAADGTVYCGSSGVSGVGITSTSRSLLESVSRLMLLRFGVHCSSITRTGRAGSRHGTFRRNHDQYQMTVTHRPDIARLCECVRIPGIKRGKLQKLAESCSYSYDAELRVLSQDSVGVRHVYDIMVDHPDHLFVLGNGLIVSNSGKKDDFGSYVGFDALKNLTMVPDTFDVKASVADRDGTVTAIEKAPQGGSYVILDNDSDGRIYVPAALPVSVKEGDTVEAGDALSKGLVSPADVVLHKGIGEGRRYFANRFSKVFRDSKYGVNRRNVEVLSRALVNNVQVEREDSAGSGLPGDILRYSSWVSGYRPREGSSTMPAAKSVGRYLETPVMHYTVGTRITPNVVKSMSRHGVTDIVTHADAPGVVPHMVSVVESPAYSEDWMARLGTSYLKERLLDDAQSVSSSPNHSINPIPSLARGVEFGDSIEENGVY